MCVTKIWSFKLSTHTAEDGPQAQSLENFYTCFSFSLLYIFIYKEKIPETP